MRYESSTIVKRAPEEVWAFLSDPFNVPRFTRGEWLEFRRDSPGPIGLGSSANARAIFFGLEFRLGAEVVEWNPPHGWAVRAKGAGFRSVLARIDLEPTAHGTMIRRREDYEPRPASRLMYWIAWPFLERRWRAADQHAKQLLEGGGD